MPEVFEAWGRAARSGSRYEHFQTYLWDSVCSAGVSFCFQKSMFWKDFLLEEFSKTDAIPGYKKTPVRPHFDKSQKGNMFSDCGAMYVT